MVENSDSNENRQESEDNEKVEEYRPDQWMVCFLIRNFCKGFSV